VLETGEITRVGSSELRQVDVLVIAATNRPLDGEVQAGRFRADLYYRLNVVELPVPALRERRDDIPLLAEHFVARFARVLNHPLGSLTDEARSCLMSWDWPGTSASVATSWNVPRCWRKAI
jgi:DNA-binding NtrC family response regulator